MGKFDELMLEIHDLAKKQAFDEAEKLLINEKNFKALDRLQNKRIMEGIIN